MRGLRRLGLMFGIAACAGACGAGWRRAGDGDGHWSRATTFGRAEHVLDRLGASEEQRARVRVVLSRSFTELEPWPDLGRRLRADLLAAWRTEHPDSDALHARVDTEVEALRSLGHALVDDGVTLHAALTPAQRAHLVELAARRHRHRSR